MNEIDALLGMGITDEEQLRALSDALRGQKRAADFFAASTVPTIRQAAQAEQAGVSDAAKQAGALRRAMLDRESRENMNRANNAAYLKRAMQASTGTDNPKYVQPYRDPDGNLHTIGWVGRQIWDFTTNQPLENLQGFTPDPMSEYQVDRSAQRNDEIIKFPTRLVKGFERADDLMRRFTVGGDDPRAFGDMPGAGTYSGKSGTLGWMARKGEEFIEGEGPSPDDIFSAMKDIRHILVQESAGLTQSLNEMAALKGISGDELLTNPEVFMKYYDEIKERVYEQLQRKYASAPPGMQAEWRRNFEGYKEKGMTPWYEWEPEFLEFPQSTDRGIRRVLPGRSGRVSNSDRRRSMDRVQSGSGWSDEDEARYQELLRKQQDEQDIED